MVVKKEVIVDCRKNRKFEKIWGLWIYDKLSGDVFWTKVLSIKEVLDKNVKDEYCEYILKLIGVKVDL